jgi:hypothetical protein
MKTYNLDFDRSLSRYGKKLNNEKILTKNNWVIVDDSVDGKSVYFFGKNNEIVISNNGNIQKGRWNYFGKDKLVIEENEKSFLFELGYFDKNYLVLNEKGCKDYAFFVNEKSWNREFESVEEINDFLIDYIDNVPEKKRQTVSGIFGFTGILSLILIVTQINNESFWDGIFSSLLSGIFCVSYPISFLFFGFKERGLIWYVIFLMLIIFSLMFLYESSLKLLPFIQSMFN